MEDLSAFGDPIELLPSQQNPLANSAQPMDLSAFGEPVEPPLSAQEAKLRAQMDEAERPTGFLGAGASGVRSLMGALKSTGSAVIGDATAVQRQALEQQQIEKTPEQAAFEAEMQRQKGIHGDEWRTPVRAAINEPLGALHTMISQIPNSGVLLGGMYTGGAIGSTAGPVGTVVGGVIGMLLGNFAVETGNIAQGKADDGRVTEEELQEGLKQSLIKSGFITAVDTAALGLNRVLFGAPGKAVEEAINQTLRKYGVDAADKAAVSAALATPVIRDAVTIVATQAADKALSLSKRAGRNVAAMGIETVGEAGGEYGGSIAAGLPASKAEAALEGLMAAPMSLAEIRLAKKLESPQQNTIELAEALKASRQPQNAPPAEDAASPGEAEEIVPEDVELAPAPPSAPLVEASEALREQIRPAPPASNLDVTEKDFPVERIEGAPPPDDQGPAGPVAPAANIDLAEIDVEDIVAAPAPMARLLPPPARTGVYAVSPTGEAVELTTAQLAQATPEERADLVRLPTEYLKGIDGSALDKPQIQAAPKPAPQPSAPRPAVIARPALPTEVPATHALDDSTEAVLPAVVQNARAEAPEPGAKLPPPLRKKVNGKRVIPMKDERLLRPSYRKGLVAAAAELIEDGGGMQLIGGNFTQYERSADKQDEVTRLPSLNPEWFKAMNQDKDSSVSVQQVRKAVAVALKGLPLGVRQQRVVETMLDIVEDRLVETDAANAARANKEWSDVTRALGPVEPEVQTTAPLVLDEARKVLGEDLLEETIERIAREYEDATTEEYNEALSAEIERLTYENESAQEAVTEASEASPASDREGADEVGGAAQGAASQAETQDLTVYTEEDLQARENQKAEAAKKRAEAERKAAADDEVDSFVLAGSDTEADQAAARGQQDLLSRPPSPLAPQFQTGPGEVFSGGDKGRYTGRTETVAGKTFYEIEMLEGADKGKTKVIAKPPEQSQQLADANYYYVDGDLGMKSNGSFTKEKRHWMTFGRIDAERFANGDRKPYGATRRGVFVGTVSGMTLKPTPAGAPIADFGEVIEGARKHYAAAYAEQMKEAGELDIASEPLSKIWPEPDYQKLLDDGADPWLVGFIHAARDEIPPKPRRSYKLKVYVAQVQALRGFANDLLDGTISKEQVLEALDAKEFKRLKDDLGTRAELYQLVGHKQSLKGVRIQAASYSVHKGVEYKPAKIIWTVEKKAKATAFSNWPTELAMGDTREEAIAAFKKAVESGAFEQTAKTGKTRFDIYSKRAEKGTVYIGKKIGRDYVDLKTFDNVKAARAYLAEHQGELEEMLARFKNVPNERRDTNSPRIGIDHRGGADITPEQFAETFGFRGGQFGTTILKKQSEAQDKLNETYDALMDLAGILGLPPKALSLNGELGLAFGARGRGGKGAPSAHYEPGDSVDADNVVINLTRKRGAGSLAHEWFHAVDNYFARMRAEKSDRTGGAYLTERVHRPGEGVRPEMINAFKSVRGAVMNAALKERSARLDRTRTKPYWSTGREMTARAFESYVIEKLRDQGASNDYLANIVSPEYWKAATALGLEQESTYPYPEAAEIPAIRAAFDQFFTTVEARETERGVGLFARRAAQPFYSVALRAVENAAQKKALPQQWEAYLKKSGVKQEEIDWLGLNAEFAKGKPLTQDELVDFIRANEVTVEDVVKSDRITHERLGWMKHGNVYRPSSEFNIGDIEYLPSNGMYVYRAPGGTREVFETLDEAKDAALRVTKNVGIEETKYAQWQVPGGENYRELLITLPAPSTPTVVPHPTKEGFAVQLPNGRLVGQSTEPDSVGTLNPAFANNWTSEADALRYGVPFHDTYAFRSPHFEEPNIVAHIRFNERTDSDGKRVLFIEEVQSDWGQRGRSEGFGDSAEQQAAERALKDAETAMTEAQAELGNAGLTWSGDRTAWAVFNDRGERAVPMRTVEHVDKTWSVQPWGSAEMRGPKDGYVSAEAAWYASYQGGNPSVAMTAKQFKAWEGLQKAVRANSAAEARILNVRRTIPSAPFVGKTKSWAMLGMKRAIRYAAENGFDRVAWTTGQVQADRYDLSKQVDNLRIVKDGDGYHIRAVVRGDVSHDMGTHDAKALPDVIGKDLAERAVNELQEAEKAGDEPIVVYEGADLTVGGEGMKGFYDQILPKEVGRYIKKWGVKVQPARIITRQGTGNEMAEWTSIAGETIRDESDTVTAHAFDITDAMRESVMQGQPLFHRRPLSDLKWTEVIETANGPAFLGPEITLFPAGNPYAGMWADGAGYTIVDSATGENLGVAVVPMDGGKVTGVHWIEATQQGRGMGRKVVKALLANTDTLSITSIIDPARGFWDKMGAENYDAENNASITRDSHARAERGAGVLPRIDEESAGPASRDQARDEARQQTEVTKAPGRGLPSSEVLEYLGEKLGKGAVKKLIDSGDFVIVETAADLPASAKRKMAEGDVVYGYHDPEIGKSYLVAENLNRSGSVGAGNTEDAYAVFLHEVGVHYGMYEILGEKLFDEVVAEVRKAADAKAKTPLGEAAKRAREQMHPDTKGQERDEETLAWLVTDAANHNLPLIKRIIAKIRAFLVRMGITRAATPDALVELARGAAMRAAGKTMATQSLFARTSITDTPAFKRWFGDSKVVDENGEPLVVYHGTIYDVSEFDPIKRGHSTGAASAKMGFFFASDPAVASSYARGYNAYRDNSWLQVINKITGGWYETLNEALLRPFGKSAIEDAGVVMPVHLAIKNPLILDYQGKDYRHMKYAEVVTLAKNEGHDGVLLKNTIDPGFTDEDGADNVTDVWVAFSPTQIKSATGNHGTFDPENPDIRFARRAGNALQPPRTQAAKEELVDMIVYNVVDRFKDLKDIQESIGAVPESQDAKLAEQLFPGRARKRLDDLDDFHVRPLLEVIANAGLKIDEIGRYLHARHAEEANRVLKDRNPNRKDNEALSGMTDAEARQIMAQYANNTAMQDVARRVDAINLKRLQKLVTDGLLSLEEASIWHGTYQHYVPLHREEFTDTEGVETLPARGAGYHIAGKESKLRAGSTKQVDHEMILPYVISQYEASAIRGEKNLVGQTLLELVANNPDPDLWAIDEYERSPHMEGGEVVYRPDTRMHDNELGIKVNGKLTRIVFSKRNPRAMRLVKELKNLAGRDMPKFLQYAHVMMRYLSMVNTSLSPEFVLSNFARDMQTAGYNLGDTEIDELRWQILRDAVRHGAKGMWDNLHHRHDTEWAKYADEFERAGGMVGWIQHYDNIQDRAKRLEREVRMAGSGLVGRKALRGLVDIISSSNAAIENAVRLSSFVHARRHGMSAKQAASLAKNLTVNFNQRGAQSQYLNLAYLFFNASVQGSARMIRAMAKSQKVRKMVAATVVAAVVLDIMNRLIGGDDDDDRSYYDKIPDGVKDRNLIIFYGQGADKYVQLPLPWGYNVFHVLGQSIGKTAMHTMGKNIPGFSVAGEAARLLGATLEAFNPLSSGSFMQMVSPTLLDPAVQISENKEWHGGPLAPEKNPFGPPQPNSERYFRSVSEPSKIIASELNELTGGNKLRPGWWDWSPEWIDMVWSHATGSAGKFLLDTSSSAYKVASGEAVAPEEIPFIRKVVGREYRSADYELYYDRKNDLDILANELRKFKGAERAEARAAAGDKVKAIGIAKLADTQLKALRKRRRHLEDTGAPQAERDAVDDKIVAVMKRFNKQYDEIVN